MTKTIKNWHGPVGRLWSELLCQKKVLASDQAKASSEAGNAQWWPFCMHHAIRPFQNITGLIGRDLKHRFLPGNRSLHTTEHLINWVVSEVKGTFNWGQDLLLTAIDQDCNQTHRNAVLMVHTDRYGFMAKMWFDSLSRRLRSKLLGISVFKEWQYPLPATAQDWRWRCLICSTNHTRKFGDYMRSLKILPSISLSVLQCYLQDSQMINRIVLMTHKSIPIIEYQTHPLPEVKSH